MRIGTLIAACLLWLFHASAQDFRFDSSMSRAVLENYLSRSISFTELLHDDLTKPRNERGVDPRDNMRLVLDTKAKLVGRALMVWGREKNLPAFLETAKPYAAALHQADPDIILQAAAFEIVTRGVETISIPERVLLEFGQPVTSRTFRYQDMLYPDGRFVSHWGGNGSVPDMSQLETRMWFYFLVTSYIDVGIEAIHFGQVGLMDKNDPGHAGWLDMLSRVRAYAGKHARRHFLVCDAHAPTGGFIEDGKLLFDFHSFPLRITEVADQPHKGGLKVGYADSIFTKSKGGMTPSGWTCEHLPFLVEFDNFGRSNPGNPSKSPFIWGWDEITWFALITAEWFASEAGRAITEAIVSFQTPSGGWSKHVRFDRGPRTPGMHWSSQTDPWHYVGTFDNRSTTEQLRLLAGAQQAAARDELSAAFLRGLDYILAAQFSNGGWPQGYPLEGKYHDEITLNDDALTHILELLRDVAAGLPEFAFVDDSRRAGAREAFAAGLRCLVKMQVIQNGQPTVWCAQHDPLTLAPAAARLKEPASLSGAESAGLLKFLMRLPEPSPEIVATIEAALAWFERSRLTGLRPTQRDGRSFYATDPTATDAYWARFYDVQTNRPIFAGAQDGIIYDSFEEMWTHNRFGYDYFTRKPEDLLTKERERWRKLLAKGAAK